MNSNSLQCHLPCLSGSYSSEARRLVPALADEGVRGSMPIRECRSLLSHGSPQLGGCATVQRGYCVVAHPKTGQRQGSLGPLPSSLGFPSNPGESARNILSDARPARHLSHLGSRHRCRRATLTKSQISDEACPACGGLLATLKRRSALLCTIQAPHDLRAGAHRGAGDHHRHAGQVSMDETASMPASSTA